jgi:DNA-binding NtrC family response regulator
VVIDDEAAMCENIQRMLRPMEAQVEAFQDPRAGLEYALADPPQLLLLDMKMPGLHGEEVFARLHQAHPEVRIVFLTAFGSVEGAVLAMRNGAFDYLPKPFKREDLLLVAKRALESSALEREVKTLRNKLAVLGPASELRSASPAMQMQIELCRRAASTNATVMILGESGSGKEVLARFIHANSQRSSGPFVAVECSAMPGSLIESELFGYERGAFTGAERAKKGLIEAAQGGTLFLDEIGDLGVELQTRLFRFVEERECRRLGGLEPVRVDCRILCATNQDLAAKIKAGSFREELFYRLGVVTIQIPPLRERSEDIPQLARQFLETYGDRYGRRLTASAAFYEALQHCRWPGNVRQLKNAMERLVALHNGEQLEAADFDGDSQSGAEPAGELARLPWKEARERYLAGFETAYARSVLNRCAGNLSAAAREAGVDRKTFYLLLKREQELETPVEE